MRAGTKSPILPRFCHISSPPGPAFIHRHARAGAFNGSQPGHTTPLQMNTPHTNSPGDSDLDQFEPLRVVLAIGSLLLALALMLL